MQKVLDRLCRTRFHLLSVIVRVIMRALKIAFVQYLHLVCEAGLLPRIAAVCLSAGKPVSLAEFFQFQIHTTIVGRPDGPPVGVPVPGLQTG